jgi:hypothetical protein
MLIVQFGHQVRCAIFIQLHKEDHRMKPHVHLSICGTMSSCSETAVTQLLGRSCCNGCNLGLVHRRSRNFNLVISCGIKVTVLRMSCGLVRRSTHHVIDHVVVRKIHKLHFVQVSDGTILQALFREVCRSRAVPEVNGAGKSMKFRIDRELDLKVPARRRSVA